MIVAVLLAGGSGSRMGANKPKQFLEVNGKTILEYTIEAFADNKNVDEICIICKADFVHDVEQIVERHCKENKDGSLYSKVKRILPGGKERYDSSLAAINAYQDDDTKLLLHDAVRPLVTQRIIDECIQALDEYNAVDVAIPCTDTIIQVTEHGTICQTPSRSTLRNVQTPQGFRRGTIRLAYEKALKDPSFQTTDDCGVVFKYLPETPIKVIDGDVRNIKITYPNDLLLLQN